MLPSLASIPDVAANGFLVVLLLVIGGALGAWIKRGPEQRRAENEGEQIKINEAELIRTDYALQVRDFRKEVHGYRNDMQVLQGKLTEALNISTRRGDRLDMVFFILRLVMGELRRLDPNSPILTQAEQLLSQVEEDDRRDRAGRDGTPKSPALNAAQHSVSAARLAEEEVRQSEHGKDQT